MRIKIGTKIFIVLFIFFIEILLFMFTFSAVNRHHEQVMHRQHEEMEELDLVRSLQIALAQVVMPANDFLILGGAENEKENFTLLSQKVAVLLDELDKITSDDTEERELVAHIKEEYLQVKDTALKIFSLPNAVGNPKAGRLMEEMDRVANDALKDAEEFRHFVQQETEKAHLDMERIKNTFDIVTWAGTLFNIIFIFGLLFFFRRTIILPIKSMRSVALEIGKGDLERKITLKNKDEIGDLAASFNKMTEGLQRITVSKNYVDSIIKGIIDTLIVVDREGKIKTVNQAAIELLGYSEDELTGMPAVNLFVAREIKEILDEFTESVCLVSKDFKIIEANSTFLKTVGFERRDAIGRHCYEVTHHRKDICMPPYDKCPILGVNEKDEPCVEQHTHINKEGAKFLVNVTAAPIRDKRGEIYYLHVASRADKAQEARSPQDSVTIGLLIQKLQFYMETLEKERIFRENDLDELSKMGAAVNLEVYYRAKSQEKIPVNFSASVMKNNEGEFLGIVFIARDMREVKRLMQKEKEVIIAKSAAEAERAKAEEIERLYRDLKQVQDELRQDYDFQNAINSLLNFSLKDVSIDDLLKYTIDLPWLGFEPRGSIFLVEDCSPDILTMKAETRLSEQIKSLCAKVPLGKCLCGRALLTQEIQFADHIDQRHEITYEGIRPHGHYCVPIIFAGKVIGVINMYTIEGHRRSSKEEDALRVVANVLGGIIARKQAEEKLKQAYGELKTTHTQLIQSEKMAAVGLLASGVAHEIKNPLAIIIQGIEYLKSSVFPDASIRDTAERVIKAALRADKIVKALLNFSRQTSSLLEAVDIVSVVEESLSLIEQQLGLKNIKISKKYGAQLPKVKADANQISQVFINLLVNSIDAMPEGGLLTINLEQVELKPGQKFVRSTFTDTGCGISEENIKRVFDPFFSTKKKEGSAGLGLSVSKGIIEEHYGTIELKSKVGEGTSVIINLPVV